MFVVPSILYAASIILAHFFPTSVFAMNDCHLGQELGMGGRVGCRRTNLEEPATALLLLFWQ